MSAIVKYGEVTQPVCDKHGSKHAPAFMPHLSICCEDSIAKKRTPKFMPLRTMSKVGKLGGKYSFDLLRISCYQDSLRPSQTEFSKVTVCRRQLIKSPRAPVNEVVIVLAFANMEI